MSIGLWIRSQDKTELIKVTRIQAANSSIYTFSPDDKNDFIKLSTYDTKVRAMKVLDEVQAQLVKQNNTTFGMKVFEMPKE